MQKINVLMTGGGAPGAPGIIKCLLQADWINLLIADADPEATGRFMHPAFVQIPRASEDNFTEEVLRVCRQHHIQVVLPLVTRELFPLSKAKEAFTAEGIKVLVSPAGAIERANNKAACYQYLAQKGVPVPRYHVVNTTEDFIHAAYELGHPQQDFCFKPSISNGSRGFRIVSDSIDESSQLFDQKPYNTYIPYPIALGILSAKPFPQLLVTEYLAGEEYSVDCLAQEGRAVLIVPRLRTKMINGISVKGTFVKDEAIIDYCRRVIEAIGLHGNIGIQVKKRASGEPLLLEINPRVQGTIVAALGAGVNLPLLALKQELGMPIELHELGVVWGTKFSRYWTEVFH
ncbi:MAG TPA: ATP-grasp domain-containing protein [Chitinophagaceae bacterium]